MSALNAKKRKRAAWLAEIGHDDDDEADNEKDDTNLDGITNYNFYGSFCLTFSCLIS